MRKEYRRPGRNAYSGRAPAPRIRRSDTLYVKALAAPFTVNTIPEKTLLAHADHGAIGPIMAANGGDSETALAQFAKADISVDARAARLQDEGAKSFVQSWQELLAVIATKCAALMHTP